MFIESNKKSLYLDTCVVKPNGSLMTLKSATVYWKCKNVLTGENDQVTLGSVPNAKKITFEERYWTFDLIKDRLGSDNVKLEAMRHCNGCRIQPNGSDLNLNKFGLLLGFPMNTIISDGVWMTSPNDVDVNQGLRYIIINCDIIDTYANYDTGGKRSYSLATFPVTTKQSLNGSVSYFRGVNSDVMINNGCFNRLDFDIKSNIEKKVDVNALLELYIQ